MIALSLTHEIKLVENSLKINIYIYIYNNHTYIQCAWQMKWSFLNEFIYIHHILEVLRLTILLQDRRTSIPYRPLERFGLNGEPYHLSTLKLFRSKILGAINGLHLSSLSWYLNNDDKYGLYFKEGEILIQGL